MATERQLVSKFMTHLRRIPSSWWYKIPDVPGGTQKRPFDIVGVAYGIPVAIECKKLKGVLKPHQEIALKDFFNAGGLSYTVKFDDTEDFDLIISMLNDEIKKQSQHL